MKKATARTALLIMIATACARGVSFVREIFMGGVLGTSYVADAFNVALSVPNLLFANIAGAVGTTFIPLYVAAREKDVGQSLDFAGRVFTLVTALGVAIAIVSAVFAEPLLSVVAFGFNAETMAVAVRVGRVVFFMAACMGASAVLGGYLNANGRFLLTAMATLAYNLVLIPALLLYDRIGIQGIAAAALGGMTLQVLLMWGHAFFSGFRFKPTLRVKDKMIGDMLLLAMPVFFGSSVNQINTLIDRMLASGLAEGSISALNYSYKLINFVYGISVAVISTLIYPLLAKFTAASDEAAFKNLMTKSFSVVTLMLLPIMVAACVLDTHVVRMLFERGAFDARSTELTASALFFYALGLLFLGYRDILSRCFYATQDTKTPMINGAIALGVNIALNITLVRVMAHNGLALATSISAAVSVTLLTRSLRKKMGGIGGREIVVVFAKAALSAAAMGVVVYFTKGLLTDAFPGGGLRADVLVFGLTALLGAGVYAGCLLLLRTEEVKWLWGHVFGRKRGG